MSIVSLLLPLALFLVVVFVSSFIWASAQGQFDDLETPSHRILLEEESRKDL